MHDQIRRLLRYFCGKKVGNEVKKLCLSYDFRYEDVRHRAKVRLDDDCRGVQMLYDKHDLEVTWVKRICHKGKRLVVNIVLKDDLNDWRTVGQVAASAWVCVYDRSESMIIDQFEPDYWSFSDDYCPANNTDKDNFYKK